MVQYLDRQDFLDNYFDYHAGEHLSLIGPTQVAGKSFLAHQLLEAANRPSLDVVSLVMKPRDKTVSEWSEKLGFKEIGTWPPVKYPWQNSPPGYTLWPRHTFDPGVDNEHLKNEFRKAILAKYASGDSIIFGDEVYGLCVELGLSTELTSVWTRGSGMGCGLWTATQKPSGTAQGSIPSFVYNCPTWLFLSKDNDARNRQRFNEIGGVDGNYVAEMVMTLKKYEFLVLHREGKRAIISP